MGYILDNAKYRGLLYKKVCENTHIKFVFDEKIKSFENQPNSVDILTNNGLQIKANLLLATDGKRSFLRDLCGIKTTDKNYHQTAIIFNIKHEKPHNFTAYEKFMPSGPFAVLPRFDIFSSSIVWSVENSNLPAIKSLSEFDFNKLVKDRLGNALGKFDIITEKSYYPLTLKFTKQYYSGRVVFIGDTIHGIHPIAGQGFNLGLKDIAELTSLIVKNTRLGLDIGNENLLKEYTKKRLYQNMQMIGATEFFNGLFSNNSKILTASRRFGISTIDKLKPVKKFFIKKAMGF
jgi:2-octaprenyl-6-methoxyphenol hydroxylase